MWLSIGSFSFHSNTTAQGVGMLPLISGNNPLSYAEVLTSGPPASKESGNTNVDRARLEYRSTALLLGLLARVRW